MSVQSKAVALEALEKLEQSVRKETWERCIQAIEDGRKSLTPEMKADRALELLLMIFKSRMYDSGVR